jgi:hypothetical protein
MTTRRVAGNGKVKKIICMSEPTSDIEKFNFKRKEKKGYNGLEKEREEVKIVMQISRMHRTRVSAVIR